MSTRARLVLAVLAVAAWMSATGAALADPFADLAQHGFARIAAGVQALAASGSPRALPVIEALRDGELYASRDVASPALFIRSGGGFVDAATGASSAVDPASLRPVRENNRVREAVLGALGVLELAAPDAATRRRGAEAMFEAHDPADLDAIDRALAAERDGRVRHALRTARAAIVVSDAAAPVQERRDAIRIVAARGGEDARALLQPLAPDPAVGGQARAAMASIDRALRLWAAAQAVFYGISLGSVLLLAAVGLAITFGVMGVINMAHGELMMIGAYVTFIVQRVLAADAPSLAPLSLLVAIPMAFGVCGAAGIAIERTMIRFLYGRSLETLLATWGLSLVLQQAIRSLFGPTNVEVGTPGWLSGSVAVFGLQLELVRIAIIVFAGLVLAAVMLVLRATPFGLQMRAVTQNRRMAAAMGIRTARVDALTFGLGSGVAGLAGVAVSQIDNVSPNLGQNYIIDSFMVVVFGGVGNLWGTLVGALGLGIVNKLLEPFAGAVLGKIAILLLVIAFIQRRPRGLFPVRGRGVET